MTTTTGLGVRWQEALSARARVDVGGGIATIMAMAERTLAAPRTGPGRIISFAGGLPDPATFPGAVLSELMAEVVAAGDESAFQYASTQGLAGPRDFVASRLERLQGLRPADGELLITSGAIEALELVSKTYLDPGDTVVVEGPTYLGAIMAFRSYEARVLAVPLDDGGLRVDALEDLLRDGVRPKLVYVIPEYQNPAGVTLTADRRTALVDLARRYGFPLVEDVAYRELPFGADPPPSLWSLAPDAVVQVGTFSKTFFPGVRLGWAVGPDEVVARLVGAKQNSDQCASALAQRLLELYGRRGHLDERNRFARGLYARRGALLMAALERHMPPGVTWTRPEGGFFSWLTVPGGPDGGLDTGELADRALAEGVAIVPGAPFFPDGRGTDSVRLCFSRVTDDDVDEGARRLGGLLAASLTGR